MYRSVLKEDEVGIGSWKYSTFSVEEVTKFEVEELGTRENRDYRELLKKWKDIRQSIELKFFPIMKVARTQVLIFHNPSRAKQRISASQLRKIVNNALVTEIGFPSIKKGEKRRVEAAKDEEKVTRDRTRGRGGGRGKRGCLIPRETKATRETN